MTTVSASSGWVPFPRVPPDICEAFTLGDLRLRRFGTAAEDFALDFTAWQPRVITTILAQCSACVGASSPPERFFWALPVGLRTAGLLQLTSFEGDEIAAVVRCPVAACAHDIEIELSISELLALHQERAAGPIRVTLDGATLLLRRPTGLDQRQWRGLSFADARAARVGVLRTLITEGDFAPTDERLEIIETALDDADPLVDFSLTLECPFCGGPSPRTLDLAGLALHRLREAQSSLIETVHLLAIQYHWSEAEILDIPPWRRARYLALIEGEAHAR